MPGLVLDLPHGTAVLLALSDPRPPQPVPGTGVGGTAAGQAAAARAVPTIAIEDAIAALHPAERAFAEGLSGPRRRDWVAGRSALREALARLGRTPTTPLLADDRGAPMLPEGVVGSISHKRGVAVALAAVPGGAPRFRIGVDVEVLAPPRIDIAPRVLTDRERAALDGLDTDARGRAVALRFAIKEAVYKAVDPFVRRYVGFREVAVWPGARGEATVEVLVDQALPLSIEAAWTAVDELVVCSARADRR